MAQITSQFELSLKKNKLDLLVLSLQTGCRKNHDAFFATKKQKKRRHDFFNNPIIKVAEHQRSEWGKCQFLSQALSFCTLDSRALGSGLRLFEAQGLWKARLGFFPACSSPSKSGLGFLKSSQSLGWTLEQADLFFSCVCWIEIVVAQVLCGFLWICCRIKAHVQTQFKLRFRADHCPISPLLFRKRFLYHVSSIQQCVLQACWVGGHSTQKAKHLQSHEGVVHFSFCL